MKDLENNGPFKTLRLQGLCRPIAIHSRNPETRSYHVTADITGSHSF